MIKLTTEFTQSAKDTRIGSQEYLAASLNVMAGTFSAADVDVLRAQPRNAEYLDKVLGTTAQAAARPTPRAQGFRLN